MPLTVPADLCDTAHDVFGSTHKSNTLPLSTAYILSGKNLIGLTQILSGKAK